ncbi:MAG: UTP--glucose-1-phosphate uridylyltransferase [Deltaproteobacteria bacterium]|nr:UTP--glucose-1-phosphate uridylyltransferase [Deltaproteobacteria bacterium]MBW2413801.1 UTP--glucose-1-phosphate uridylyltransferase [Deltaproteobacteria bacterium]
MTRGCELPDTWDWSEIDADVERQLEGVPDVALDRAAIEGFAARISAGELDASGNQVVGADPAGPGDVDSLDRLSKGRLAELEARGREAIESGQVAVAVLNGGMATRFGGTVKGIIEAIGGRSFLEVKLAQARGHGPVPFLVMNSFATHAATGRFLAERGLDSQVRSFLQSVSLRLTPEGALFRGDDGHVSLYAPGHGDFPEALRRSGRLDELRAEGVRVVVLSNVDNLGAELDARIIGLHLEAGRPLTCEVAAAVPGDAGGTPARVDGELQIVEGFRFPPGFDFSKLHFLATNTFAFSLDLLRQEHPLTWFYVEKTVEGRAAVQMERLVNELSACVPTTYLEVPRGGPQGRFFPVKTLDDLDALRGDAGLARRFS